MSTAQDASTAPDCGSTPVPAVGQGTPERKFRRIEAILALPAYAEKSALLVGCMLAAHTDSTGVITMPVPELERLTGLTHTAIRPAIAALEAAGVLRAKRTGRATVFTWLEPAYTTQRKCSRERPAAPR